MFIWKNEDLNEEQANSIKQKGSVLLTACPGSGKTRALTFKIADELSKLETERQFVIAITYTHAAADEIKERVELLGIDTSQLWIGTIHSFCLEWILKPYYIYLDQLKNGFRIINAHQSEDYISEIAKDYHKIRFNDCQYFATPRGHKIQMDQSHWKFDSVKEILSKYFKILKKNNQIDFEQILYYSYLLLKDNHVIAKTLSKLFKLIAVDEYQDTKEIQYYILASICGMTEEINVFIVGDANQSIYSSLGGYPMSMDELKTLFKKDIQGFQLSRNYRSSKKIISYFEQFKVFANEIQGEGQYQDHDSLITLNSTVEKDDLVDEIVRLLKLNIETLSISPNEICIVAPWWIHLAGMTRALMVKLPNLNFNGPGMAPFSRDIENFWFKLSRIVLTEPSPYLYVRRLRWSTEVLNDLESAGYDTSKLHSKAFLKICNSITLDEKDGLIYLKKFFGQICEKLSLDIGSYPMLIEHHKSFFESATQRIDRLTKEGNEFIGTIENFRKVFKQKDGITISTIHGVKGEEYDVVISYALLEGYVPNFNDKNKQESSKKLLYVIGSRARKNLHLISERKRFKPFGSPPEEYQMTEQLKNYDFRYSEI